MRILRTIGILALVAGLVLGGVGTAFAEKPDDVPRGGGPHSPGKRGLSGNVTSVETIPPAGEEYIIHLETKQGTFEITANATAKYMVPRETHGPQDLTTFIDIVDVDPEDGHIDELVGRRLAVLVTLTNESTADAIRLMLIPSVPLHAHRVGVVETFVAFVAGADGSIEIIDRDGESHTFTVNEDTVYRPADIDPDPSIAIVEGVSHVTVVTKGDPKLGPVAKAIVLHEKID